MSSAVARPRQRRRLSRATVTALLSLGCVIAAAAIIVTIAQAPGDRRSQAALPTAPGPLTATEQAAVIEALSHGDSRQRHIARQVAGGEAGASALAAPAILHHHGVDTSRRPARPTGEVGAERFHHR